MRESTQWWRGLFLLPAIALAGTWACRHQQPVKLSAYAKGSPPSCFRADPTTLSVPAIQKLIASRAIDFDTVWGAADSALVDFANGQVGTGYWASIEPEDSAWYIDPKVLEQGCIIARISSKKAAGSFGPWPGGTWWFVDRRDTTGSGWRSFFIRANDTTSLAKLQAHVMAEPTKHRDHVWNQSIARFKSGSVAGWGVCSDYCCEAQMQ